MNPPPDDGDIWMPFTKELAALQDAKDFFESEIGCGVEIIHSHTERSDRALKADPGKPGIEVV